MVSPEMLRLHSIPVVKVVQYPGEYIINAPGAGMPDEQLVTGDVHASVLAVPCS